MKQRTAIARAKLPLQNREGELSTATKFLEFATIKLADGSIVHTVLLSSIPLKKLKNRDTARARSAEDKANKP